MTEKIINRRRKLLPLWMKFFIWLFMLIGVSQIFIIFWTIIGSPIEFTFLSESTLYGMETNEHFTLLGLIISILIIFKAYTAFAMWTEKNWAIRYGLIDGLVGLIVCIIMMIVKPIFDFVDGSWDINLRFEILFLIPYLIKCWKIRKPWENLLQPVFVKEKPIMDPQKKIINVTPSEETIIKDNKTSNIDGIDKEDPTRFMPK